MKSENYKTEIVRVLECLNTTVPVTALEIATDTGFTNREVTKILYEAKSRGYRINRQKMQLFDGEIKTKNNRIGFTISDLTYKRIKRNKTADITKKTA